MPLAYNLRGRVRDRMWDRAIDQDDLMSDNKLPYEAAEVDQPIDTGRETQEGRRAEPTFGAFMPRSFLAVAAGASITNTADFLTRFVSVHSTGAALVQLGSYADSGGGGSSVPVPAGESVMLPAQGALQVSVRAVALSDVCIVWHDDPIRIWR